MCINVYIYTLRKVVRIILLLENVLFMLPLKKKGVFSLLHTDIHIHITLTIHAIQATLPTNNWLYHVIQNYIMINGLKFFL